MSSTPSSSTGISGKVYRANTSLDTLQKDSDDLLSRYQQMVIDETEGWENHTRILDQSRQCVTKASRLVSLVPGKLGCPSLTGGYTLPPAKRLSARMLPTYNAESGSFLCELAFTLASDQMLPPTPPGQTTTIVGRVEPSSGDPSGWMWKHSVK